MARTVSRSPTVTLRVVRPHLRVEKELMRTGTPRLAAMDEVGRGALAGPVTVGVVVVTERIGRVPAGLRDSKLLTPAARAALVKPVRRWVGEWGIGHASPAEIDTIGIIAALRTAGRRALAQLSAPVDAVLLDGNHNYLSTPVDDQPTLFDSIDGAAEAIDGAAEATAVLPREPPVHVRIKADLTCAAVAGASVLAKTERDRLLTELAATYPEYGFDENKGYGTPEHVAALRAHGPSMVHRQSWRLPCGADDGQVRDGMMMGSWEDLLAGSERSMEGLLAGSDCSTVAEVMADVAMLAAVPMSETDE
jgi:ribonuclease HII